MGKIVRLSKFPVLFISMARTKRGRYLSKITQLTDVDCKNKRTEGEIAKKCTIIRKTGIDIPSRLIVD